MAILSLKSTNPNFSYIIHKNPNSHILVKQLREGYLFGWFTRDDQYNAYFKDGEDEVSFKKHPNDDFEYINTSRYDSPIFITTALKELFHHMLRVQKDEKDTDGFENTLFINMVYFKYERGFEYFQKYYTDYKIESQKVGVNSYRMTIRTNKSIHHLLNFANLFAIFATIYNDVYLHKTDDLIAKYMDALNTVESPYFVRYIFKTKLLGESKNMFDKYKSLLEKHPTDVIEMEFGDTLIQRRNILSKELTFKNPIIDIGCGPEANHIRAFANKLTIPGSDKKNDYIAIDIDKEALESAQKIVQRKEMTNVHFFESFEDFSSNPMLEEFDADEKFDIILSEVIEHMELEEATRFVKSLLEFPKLNKLIITTPCSDFNKNYSDCAMRREDHKWEMTSGEFLKWCAKLPVPAFLAVRSLQIGDLVNGVPVSQGVVFERVDFDLSSVKELSNNQTEISA